MTQAIAYLRVSTGRQGSSGLGVEAQRETIARFCAAEGYTLAAEHVEVETGKGADALDRRPELAAALAQAKGGASTRAAADAFAANVLPVIRQVQAPGVTSFAAIADALNARGVAASRGGRWYAATVRKVLTRGAT